MLAVVLLSTPAHAGPPFKTDDPQPVDFLHWELYVASMQEFGAGETHATAPHLELNYGVFRNMQLHLVTPLGYAHGGDGTHYGYADTEIGVKYRLVDETGSLPQVGVFPLVEIPTGNPATQLGSGTVQAYLPVWLQKSWGKLTTYGGAGFWYNPGTGQKNWLFAGWEMQYDFTDALTVGGELYHQTADSAKSDQRTGFNVGGFVNLSENHHILFSVGRDTARNTNGYVGYQLTI
jgi:hypothetical protein